MSTHQFYIKEERLSECKKMIRTLKSARFVQNPFKTGKQYSICVSFGNINDGNKMDELLAKWYIEDNQKIKKENLFQKIKKYFKNL